ncbi:hypothetical protein BT96DRAFT_181263 [Gymnopus androsaceus JB14]|uniref:Uncharacterized protein n=1 Tax=Gymnopus androsaceus JB14 TaxID=1447944 RepID=A0A6A4H971_9AGAR|nr:hypothetical protein BT96DRAFT_181263 [Gymnopus androsaceus JB14]
MCMSPVVVNGSKSQLLHAFQLSVQPYLLIIHSLRLPNQTQQAGEEISEKITESLEVIMASFICYSPILSMCFSADGIYLMVCMQTGVCLLDMHMKEIGSPAQTPEKVWDWPPLGSPVTSNSLLSDDSSLQIIELAPIFSSAPSVVVSDAQYASITSPDGLKSLCLHNNGYLRLIDHTQRAISSVGGRKPGSSTIIARFPIEFIQNKTVVMFEAADKRLVRIAASDNGVLQASLDFKWSALPFFSK